MARHVYNGFVRVFLYFLPFWLGGFEFTVHEAMNEKDPLSFLAPGVMLSAIALLVPLCLARKEPGPSATTTARWMYRCDVTLIAVAFSCAIGGMPLWHLTLGASLSGNFDGWPAVHFFFFSATTSIALMYYVFAVILTELKRLAT
ncbi:hypothetical protein AWB70_05643 [Caballeronia cordobensis]|uniref:Uncharacterized protein n=1 Tax=Caballeronia cordobensis TaxID=1353886 RepID=A0A158J0N7_CABCO|nr:hypothetical protein [Caballeronia cordobensis]SAL62063.1 hypothetical protein AWB70_05643 [Caballeronia cordobensis]